MPRPKLTLERALWGRTYAIGIYAGPSPSALAPAPGAANPVLTRASVTDAPAVYVADPFLFRDSDRWLLFLEVQTWRPGAPKKGEIAVASSPDGLRWSYERIVLAEPFHLSYPQVFAWRGERFMVPESGAARAVRLYRADPFPTRWRHVANLLEGAVFSDSTLFRHDGRWWLLTETSGGRHATLRLFQSRELLGPWREHPRSPIVENDPAIARPAGGVIATPGGLVRFAQDCGAGYGGGVRAFAIDRLGPEEYRERALAAAPLLASSGRGWNADGMHQLDAHPLPGGGWLAAVDGWARTVRRPAELYRWAAERLARS